MVLTGNVALESMGFKTFGFAGGRVDDWEADMVYWGPEAKFLADERFKWTSASCSAAGRRANGPYLREPGRAQRQPGSARRSEGYSRDVRSHGDERRGDRRADRRWTDVRQGPWCPRPGQVHRSGTRRRRPRTARIRLGKQVRQGNGADTITSGLEGAWSPAPTAWSTQYLDNLYAFDWVQTKSPAGATQWVRQRPRHGHGAGCARSDEAPRADHVHHRHCDQDGSGLREDLDAFPREARRICASRLPRPGSS